MRMIAFLRCQLLQDHFVIQSNRLSQLHQTSTILCAVRYTIPYHTYIIHTSLPTFLCTYFNQAIAAIGLCLPLYWKIFSRSNVSAIFDCNIKINFSAIDSGHKGTDRKHSSAGANRSTIPTSSENFISLLVKQKTDVFARSIRELIIERLLICAQDSVGAEGSCFPLKSFSRCSCVHLSKVRFGRHRSKLSEMSLQTEGSTSPHTENSGL